MQIQTDANGCADKHMSSQIDCRMCSRTTRLPDGLSDNQTSEQADLQNRWISRQIDAQPDMQMGMQQNQLTRLKSLLSHSQCLRYNKVPNAVSAENPWHRWTSNWRYQANDLRNAWKEPARRPRNAGEDPWFCLFVGVLRGRAHFPSGVGCDGVALPTPWLRHLRLLIVVDGCTLWLPTLRATPSNAETNAETNAEVNAESCDAM